MPKQNQSDPFHIGDKYGGIPLNLFTNMLGSAAIIILFLVIRKNAVKKVGRRIANDTLDNVENVTMILFGRRNNLVGSMSEDSDRQTEAHKRRRFQTMESEDEGTDRNVITNKEGISEDAVQYLSFQKFIIIYVFFTTLISVGVVLPLNFQGSQLGNGTEFGHTTLANLHPGAPGGPRGRRKRGFLTKFRKITRNVAQKRSDSLPRIFLSLLGPPGGCGACANPVF